MFRGTECVAAVSRRAPRLCVTAARFKAINVHKQTVGSSSNRKMMKSPFQVQQRARRSFFLLGITWMINFNLGSRLAFKQVSLRVRAEHSRPLIGLRELLFPEQMSCSICVLCRPPHKWWGLVLFRFTRWHANNKRGYSCCLFLLCG